MNLNDEDLEIDNHLAGDIKWFWQAIIAKIILHVAALFFTLVAIAVAIVFSNVSSLWMIVFVPIATFEIGMNIIIGIIAFVRAAITVRDNYFEGDLKQHFIAIKKKALIAAIFQIVFVFPVAIVYDVMIVRDLRKHFSQLKADVWTY